MNQVILGALSNRETYIESFQAFDEDGAVIDLTGATIVYEVRSCKDSSATLSATTANTASAAGVRLGCSAGTVRPPAMRASSEVSD